MRRKARACKVAFLHLAQRYPYQECIEDGKAKGLSKEEAEYRCKYIACCISKRKNPFKERGYCEKFDCSKKPKWSRD